MKQRYPCNPSRPIFPEGRDNLLTKSDFLLYLDAPMHLWAKAHDALAPETLPPLIQHLIRQGQEVEALARTYLEEVVLPGYADAQFFWQPAYEDGQYQIRADGLIYDLEAGVYDLYEIKSSTSVKADHIYGLTFQALVLAEFLTLRHTYLVHIDNGYQREETLDLARFFTAEDVTAEVDRNRVAVRQAREAARTVAALRTARPDFACTKPETCPCPDLCHPDLPDHPIYDLPRIGKKALKLREMGVTAIEDIPPDFPLSAKQAQVVRVTRSGQAEIDADAIKQDLAELTFPLSFLDYEAFGPAVPLFAGYRPYEQVVFQYSLHILIAPDAEAAHHACLITANEDPAPALAADLLANLPTTGSVVVWNRGAEKRYNQNLARHFPARRDELLAINKRLYDLIRPFRSGHYIHPASHGSASLKAVLPALCPDLSYETLPIQDAQEAMLTWYRLQRGDIDPEEETAMRDSMLAYSRRDTFGMVAIWRHLNNL
ncbi:MAG: DUF2779 domain-containing protein [Chloroflexota bacterium]|nr:DUF2779 domain-containing protein [Chloroflexota bacterium]